MAKHQTKKVLLIGWDAADWKIIDPLLDSVLSLPTGAGGHQAGPATVIVPDNVRLVGVAARRDRQAVGDVSRIWDVHGRPPVGCPAL